jgi:aconitate hydratase
MTISRLSESGMKMNRTLTQKILSQHLVDGSLSGEEIGVLVDRVLLQDTTGTMACLQFEALDLPQIVCERAVQYIDHNLLQISYRNADDHRFLQAFCSKYGLHFSRAGNGICHQVNLERHTVPGQILLGADSHTPTAGGAGMLGIGVGGLDTAVAMAGGHYYFQTPEIIGVELQGRLQPWVSAKDIILELLRRLSVKGGVDKIFEYYGEGVKSLSVPQRATITNMGAELGATSSIFPSDEVTRDFFKLQQRQQDWKPLIADADASYDEIIMIQLDELEPMVACPSSPGNVKEVREIEGTETHQVLIGSCTNSSFQDLMMVAEVLNGKQTHPQVDFHINPGSRQVLQNIIKAHGLEKLVAAGARIFENGCDGCVGIGSAPPTNSVSLRSFNRNFPSRSGTKGDQVYLASPEVCVAAALYGKITDPRRLGQYPDIQWPQDFIIDDSMILPPAQNPESISIPRGPNIQPLPRQTSLKSILEGPILLKMADNISTDAIIPAGPEVMALRSNIPVISEYTFRPIDPTFVDRAKDAQGGFIIAGENYGQGSSREHAAIAPMYLGVKAVIAKSFARIHKANLLNFGILPLEFLSARDYDKLTQGQQLKIVDAVIILQSESPQMTVHSTTRTFNVKLPTSQRLREILCAGGLLNYTKTRLS